MNTRSVTLVAVAALSWGCAHYFDGIVAELDDTPGLRVLRSESAYGDCFRNDKPVPVVYGIDRSAYQLRVAHGMRYVPELFLAAKDLSGTDLRIVGEDVRDARAASGDLRAILRARNTEVSYRVVIELPLFWDGRVRKNLAVEAVAAGKIDRKEIAFEVLDSAGRVLGQERLSFRLNVIRCKEIDGP